MTQSRDSRAEAAKFGHSTAAAIAEKIGAKGFSRGSNEFEFNGQWITIRTARQGNNQVGVLYDMLHRVESVIGAFEIAPDEFELLSLSPEIFQAAMRDSNTGNGRVGLVRKKVFTEKGSSLGTVKITEDTKTS